MACTTTTSCVAAGSYLTQKNLFAAAIATFADGTWRAISAPLPGRPVANSELGAISCPTPGSCVATGRYDAADSGLGRGLIETLAHGTWTPSAPPEPARASNNFTEFGDVACSAPGTCVAVGGYDFTLASTGTRALLEFLSNGNWTAAAAPAQPGAAGWATLEGVSCPYAGVCVATGSYSDTSQGAAGGARLWTEMLSRDAWIRGSLLAAPSGVLGFGPVACSPAGLCVGILQNYKPRTGTMVEVATQHS